MIILFYTRQNFLNHEQRSALSFRVDKVQRCELITLTLTLTKFSGVNLLPECLLFVTEQARGDGPRGQRGASGWQGAAVTHSLVQADRGAVRQGAARPSAHEYLGLPAPISWF